jgi:carboxyl-terminal processing protease
MSASGLCLRLALCAVLVSCGGGGGSGDTGSRLSSAASYGAQPASCAVVDQRSWLKAYMADQYFWNATPGVPDETATSLDGFFQSLLFRPTDRYSYSQATAQFTQFFSEGLRTGFGYSLAFSDAAQTSLQVRYTEPQSPVGLAGLVRGDTVVSIDGFTPAQIAEGALAVVESSGVARTFVVRDSAGTTRSFTVASATYPLAPVLASTVFTLPSGSKVGYIAYQEFIASSAGALGSAFNAFRAAGVSELIVDLRYNGGGSVTTARNLASMIGGSALEGQIFAGLRFNERNRASNFNYYFTPSDPALPAPPLEGLGRIFVIASSQTASASELVINALKPFRDVITIGSATYGKPYGFQPRDACGTTYSAVNFDSVNAQGVGGYTAGLAASCAVGDDLGHALGDPAERRIAAALGYIQTGSCPATSALSSPLASLRMRQAPNDPRSPEAERGEPALPAMLAD